jgi:energy-coupling factor transporter ATP-binding protein EcfA2
MVASSTVALLQQKLTQANFVPLIGASGSGKSSVVRAGLVPELAAQGWQVLGPIKPGVKPMAALQEAFCPLFAEPEDWPQVYELIETVGLGTDFAASAGRWLGAARGGAAIAGD